MRFALGTLGLAVLLTGCGDDIVLDDARLPVSNQPTPVDEPPSVAPEADPELNYINEIESSRQESVVGESDVQGSGFECTGDIDFSEVTALCDTLENTAPVFSSLPQNVNYPNKCTNVGARENFIAACGVPEVFRVTPDTLENAIRECEGSCEYQLAAGTYAGLLRFDDCAIVSGQGASRTVLESGIRAGNHALISLLSSNESIGVGDSATLIDVVARDDYEAVSPGNDLYVCGSVLAGGYSGVGISWQAQNLHVAGSTVTACYEGVAGAWGSEGIFVDQSIVYGHYEGVSTSWGTTGVRVTDSVLGSAREAVGIHIAPDASQSDEPPCFSSDPECEEDLPESFEVDIRDNCVVNGDLPQNDESLGIVVENNTFH